MQTLSTPSREHNVSKAWVGLALGIVLGICDLVVMRLIGIEMRHGDLDMAVPVMLVFALTFGALGYANGRLAEARAEIRGQLDELQRSQALVLQYEKLASIGRMAASVAHEVRNPLGVIKSSAGLLASCLDEGEADGRAAAAFISAEVDRLDGFIRSLLDYSRPLEPQRRAVDAGALAERIEQLASDAVGARGATLEVSRGGGPWLLDLDLVARGITTVVVNGAQAAGDGGTVTVSIADAPRGGANIEVHDDGPGVAAGVRETLFEPFVTTKAKGTGLGLPMARRIAEAHGGGVSLEESRAGRGACFRFHLPGEIV